MSLEVTSELGQSWPGADERHSEGFILILHPMLDFILGADWLWEAENGEGLRMYVEKIGG